MQHHLFQRALSQLSLYKGSKLPDSDLKRAAVLIPFMRGEDHSLLYTRRTDHLKHHPGQVSFPGGRLEPGETSWDAALRESWEEIGLPASKVRRLGQLGDAYSPRGYHICCFVAEVEPFTYKLNRHEVAEVIQVPWPELFQAKKHQTKPWKRNPQHLVHYFHFDECLVWGVTGQITFHLRDTLWQLARTSHHPTDNEEEKHEALRCQNQ